MIKKYRPRFNIELKDQQRYTYLRVSDEKYPRLLVARRTRDGKFLGKGKFYGPFTQGSSKLLTIGTLRKAFQIRICKTYLNCLCNHELNMKFIPKVAFFRILPSFILHSFT